MTRTEPPVRSMESTLSCQSSVVRCQLGVLAAVALVLPQNRASAAGGAKPNVVVITIDTLRADHLGCYGYSRIETPNLDALARLGARFTQAYTPVPITLPAHTAIFTGSFPMATGMHDFSGNKLPANGATLAKVLRDNGYTTAAFIGAAVLDSRFGLNQGFETYFDHFDFSRLDETNLDLTERRGDLVMDEALGWLKQAPRPFLLWIHLYDPHFPYTPPEPYASRYRTHLYDGEIAFADAQVGRLLSFLKQRGLFDHSVIALAGDHGEGLGEHGEKTHGFFIYNSTLHVPLILKVPGAAPRVVAEDVSLVDAMPTLLQELKLPIPASVQGRSLLGLILGRQGPTAARPSELYAETYLPLLHFRWGQLRGLESGGWQYIDAPRPELYDVRSDPRELRNLYGARQSLAHEMHDRLYGVIRRFTPASGNAASASGRSATSRSPPAPSSSRAVNRCPTPRTVSRFTSCSPRPWPTDSTAATRNRCASSRRLKRTSPRRCPSGISRPSTITARKIFGARSSSSGRRSSSIPSSRWRLIIWDWRRWKRVIWMERRPPSSARSGSTPRISPPPSISAPST
ncbi:MAG: hypothetical protein DMG26_14545 [Acidobacteria bacterium]|nr:MAG: hypothetical protein DMG26_14545 [Acidobacteriota bacterium]